MKTLLFISLLFSFPVAASEPPACITSGLVVDVRALELYKEIEKLPLEKALITLSEKVIEHYRQIETQLGALSSPTENEVLDAFRQGIAELDRNGINRVLTCKLSEWVSFELKAPIARWKNGKSTNEFYYTTEAWDFFLNKLSDFNDRTRKMTDAEVLLEFQFAAKGIQYLNIKFHGLLSALRSDDTKKETQGRATENQVKERFSQALVLTASAVKTLLVERLKLTRFYEATILDASDASQK